LAPDFALTISQLAFGIFGILHSAFGIRHLALGIWHEALEHLTSGAIWHWHWNNLAFGIWHLTLQGSSATLAFA
jgi:hypothetical protein